jgi:hypothetical protein
MPGIVPSLMRRSRCEVTRSVEEVIIFAPFICGRITSTRIGGGSYLLISLDYEMMRRRIDLVMDLFQVVSSAANEVRQCSKQSVR